MTSKSLSAQSVINNYLIISGLYTLAASLIWGVNTLFLLDAGLSIQGVFIANAAFTAGMAIFEIPTGVVADTVGRRISFLLSVVILFASTWGYVAVARNGGGLLWFAVVSVFMGLGFTFYSGAVEAWLVDALNFSGFDGSLDRVFARGAIISGAAMLFGTVGGGFLGSQNLSAPYILRSLLLAVTFIVAFITMHDLGYKSRPLTRETAADEVRQVIRASIQHGWNQRPVRLLMIVSFIQASFFAWAFYAWQPYFLDLLGQQDAIWIAGVIAAAIALATMVGNGLVERLARYCTRRTTMLLGAVVIQAIAAVGVGLSDSFWLVLAFFLIMMGATGVTQPVAQAYMHQMIPGKERATIISFNSMFSSVGSVIGQTSLGRIAQTRSIASGYVFGGLFTLLAVPVLVSLRHIEGKADQFDEQAGTKSTCAAQGLPVVSAVDSGTLDG